MEINQTDNLSPASGDGKAFKLNTFSNCSFDNYYYFRFFLSLLSYLLKPLPLRRPWSNLVILVPRKCP